MSKDEAVSNEDRLIARFFAPLAAHAGALGLTDDAAYLTPPPGHDLVLTADAVVSGVHFLSDDSPQPVASKALRVNLSDLAAKGAQPFGFLLTLALPSEIGEDWLGGFAEGLRADAARYNCPLLGGDTVRTPGPLTVSVSAVGTLPQGSMVRRAGAKPGDAIFVSGTIGDAALGLALRKGAAWSLDETQHEHLAARYRLPQPRTTLAEAVRAHASAAMDVSDGLAGDLAKLCRVSDVAAEIDAARVPLSSAAKAVTGVDPQAMETVLTGGDDYEIVCAVPADKADRFRAAARAADVPVTEIGTISTGEGVRFLGADGAPFTFARPSFSHF